MAVSDQLQFFCGRKNSQTPSQKLFKFYSHIPHDIEMCMCFFKGSTEIQNGRHGRTSYFLWVQKLKKKSEIIHILQSHYPPSGNVQVILLKFKMTTTSRLFIFLWPQKQYGGLDIGLQASCCIAVIALLQFVTINNDLVWTQACFVFLL